MLVIPKYSHIWYKAGGEEGWSKVEIPSNYQRISITRNPGGRGKGPGGGGGGGCGRDQKITIVTKEDVVEKGADCDMERSKGLTGR